VLFLPVPLSFYIVSYIIAQQQSSLHEWKTNIKMTRSDDRMLRVHREHSLGVFIHYIELLVGRAADTLYVALIFPHNIAGFGELAHLPDAPKLLVSQCMCTPSLEDLSW